MLAPRAHSRATRACPGSSSRRSSTTRRSARRCRCPAETASQSSVVMRHACVFVISSGPAKWDFVASSASRRGMKYRPAPRGVPRRELSGRRKREHGNVTCIVQEDVRVLDRKIYDLEGAYLGSESSQCGTVFKGFEGFMSSKDANRRVSGGVGAEELRQSRIGWPVSWVVSHDRPFQCLVLLAARQGLQGRRATLLSVILDESRAPGGRGGDRGRAGRGWGQEGQAMT